MLSLVFKGRSPDWSERRSLTSSVSAPVVEVHGGRERVVRMHDGADPCRKEWHAPLRLQATNFISSSYHLAFTASEAAGPDKFQTSL